MVSDISSVDLDLSGAPAFFFFFLNPEATPMSWSPNQNSVSKSELGVKARAKPEVAGDKGELPAVPTQPPDWFQAEAGLA